ncbi:hypothetical protein AAT19DRAFT_11588 [Rhodotorula toruloides]|uniref:PCI domain-containing protein n=1 Tax=Rhodotorula toruloides TaxID=5286 RepID=A0A2S9ZW02_RHOTO|nr:hypothetical protein AAT19DRAFT_11588 [Rhodotorula toruloides]
MSNYAFIRNSKPTPSKPPKHLPLARRTSAASERNEAAPVNLPGMVAPGLDPAEAAKERDRKIAAYAFTDVGAEALIHGPGHFIPPADVALYPVITGLACFSRSALRSRVLENANLRPFLNLEPYLRDIVRAFHDSQFKTGLELLKYEARLLLDIHLAPHIDALVHSIRQRAIQTYFAPFASVSLSHMAAAFGWREDYMAAAVVELIGNGMLKARIDSAKGVLVARRQDSRVEAFKNALEEGGKVEKRAVASHLRMKLMQNDLVVKPARRPGGRRDQQQQQYNNCAIIQVD